jgi:hypothetical protein
MDRVGIYYDGPARNQFLNEWGVALVQAGQAEGAAAFASALPDRSTRARVQALLAWAIADAGDADRAERLAFTAFTDAGFASLLDKVIDKEKGLDLEKLTAFARSDWTLFNRPIDRIVLLCDLTIAYFKIAKLRQEPDTPFAEFNLKLANTMILGLPSEAERLEAAALRVQKLVYGGMQSWAAAICDQTEPLAVRSVLQCALFTAMLRAPVPDPEYLRKVAHTVIQTAYHRVPRELYHFPLGLLMLVHQLCYTLEDPANTPEQAAELRATVEVMEKAALETLARLIQRDGPAGEVRALAVFRIACELNELPAEAYRKSLNRDLPETWAWLRARATAITQQRNSLAGLFDELRAERKGKREDVWNALTGWAHFIVKQGLAEETWKRIAEVDSLLLPFQQR